MPPRRIEYRVLRDTREQQGWDFAAGDGCLGTADATLRTGDYTLCGYEDLLAIERKGSPAEFAQNIVQKRFERELERLEGFKYAFVVLEFDMEQLADFPVGSGIPRARWKYLRITPQFVLARLNEFHVRFPTRFIPAGRWGREFASSLFKRVVEAEQRPCPPTT